jgi:2-iminobutanoate/2-iminopropanoate deaminase
LAYDALMSKPVGPYTPAVRAGDFIIVSGQLGLRDGAVVEGGVGAQTTQAIENLKGHLAGFGATLVDIDTFAQFNAAYSASFGESRPARSTVGGVTLVLGATVEIEAWAYKPLG